VVTGRRPAVEVWPHEAYLAFLKPVTGGLIARTHLALLRSPDGEQCRGYVKHFAGPGLTRALFNEWFCAHLVQALGLSMPRCALMEAPDMGTGPLGWAFLSCEPKPQFSGTPKEIYDLRSAPANRELALRLLRCLQLPAMLAIDQLAANADRNLGNFVFTGPSSFVAIDHSNALHGPNWQTPDTYFAQHPVRYLLLDFLESVLGRLPDGSANAVVAAADVVQDAYWAVQDALRQDMECAANPDVAAAMDMIWWRCRDLGEWFRKRMQVI
jgi:hypothetical protein